MFIKVIDFKSKKVLAANENFYLFGDMSISDKQDIDRVDDNQRLMQIFDGYDAEICALYVYDADKSNGWKMIDVSVDGYCWDYMSSEERLAIFRAEDFIV